MTKTYKNLITEIKQQGDHHKCVHISTGCFQAWDSCEWRMIDTKIPEKGQIKYSVSLKDSGALKE